jgi:microcystin-dependent protein
MNRKRIFGAVVAFILAVTLIFGTQVNSASAQTSTSGVPIGTVITYAASVKGSARGQLERQGWLVADGQAISRQDYLDLFKVIGTIYGSGNNTSTFNLPDLRGRFVRGVDDGAGRDPDAKSRTTSIFGGSSGDEVGSVQEDEFQNHVHTFTRAPLYNEEVKPGYNVLYGKSQTKNVLGRTDTETEPSGGRETRPKNIYLNYIIKANNL